MLTITLTSNIYGKTDLTGVYTVVEGTTISQFVANIRVTWDDEALIVVNNEIVDANYLLQDQDQVYFLTPIAGG